MYQKHNAGKTNTQKQLFTHAQTLNEYHTICMKNAVILLHQYMKNITQVKLTLRNTFIPMLKP